VTLAVGGGVLAIALRGLARGSGGVMLDPRGAWGRWRGDSGTATLEFVLVLPVALGAVLIVLQSMLALSGNLFIHYAAYAAARAVVVQAPTEARGGGGVLRMDEGDASYASALRASALAMAPVSGPGAGGGNAGESLADAAATLFSAAGQSAPRWVETKVASRVAYATAHTRVRFFRVEESESGVVYEPLTPGESWAMGPKSPVTVEVIHDLHLSIPFAGQLFSEGSHAVSGGSAPYTRIGARCTLTLEGYDVNLPEAPGIERSP
ncbi:MAG: hypothetical protein V3V20_09890, partial [Algisphaera sp.]